MVKEVLREENKRKMNYKIKIRTENQTNNIDVSFKPRDYDAVGYAENFIKNHFEDEFQYLLRQLDGDYDESVIRFKKNNFGIVKIENYTPPSVFRDF